MTNHTYDGLTLLKEVVQSAEQPQRNPRQSQPRDAELPGRFRKVNGQTMGAQMRLGALLFPKISQSRGGH